MIDMKEFAKRVGRRPALWDAMLRKEIADCKTKMYTDGNVYASESFARRMKELDIYDGEFGITLTELEDMLKSIAQ
jgi:hypothetical protein